MASILNKHFDTKSVRLIYSALNKRRTLCAQFVVELIYDQTTKSKTKAVEPLLRYKRLFILTKGNQIVLLVPNHRVRNTINYETYSINKTTGEIKTGNMLWGAVSNMLPKYETLHIGHSGKPSSDGRYYPSPDIFHFTKPNLNPHTFNPTKEEEIVYMDRLRKRLDLLIRLSQIVPKAEAMAKQRIETQQYTSAIQICSWLEKNASNRKALDSLLHQATGVSSDWSRYYKTDRADFSTMIRTVETKHRNSDYPKDVYREYALKAFALYKKSFNDAAYGDLIKKMVK